MVDMGEPPLIVGPHRICSSELMALLLKGVASGNFGAQNATNTAGNDWPPALGKELDRSAWFALRKCGFTSKTTRVRALCRCWDAVFFRARGLNDDLQHPQIPNAASLGTSCTRLLVVDEPDHGGSHAQVLHGGDHFTLAWAAAGGAGDGQSPPSAPSTTPSEFILYARHVYVYTYSSKLAATPCCGLYYLLLHVRSNPSVPLVFIFEQVPLEWASSARPADGNHHCDSANGRRPTGCRWIPGGHISVVRLQ
jgi:hypothetical protein